MLSSDFPYNKMINFCKAPLLLEIDENVTVVMSVYLEDFFSVCFLYYDEYIISIKR